MGGGTDLAVPKRRALSPRPLLLGWLAAIAVDLFFSAGVFSPLFDQGREPGLLPDDVLFRRIPVAYLVVGFAVVAMAWVVDRGRSWQGRASACLRGAPWGCYWE
jgi:hypothetical protein